MTDYMGRLYSKGIPFSGWRYIGDFTSQSMKKDRQNCHLGILKGLLKYPEKSQQKLR